MKALLLCLTLAGLCLPPALAQEAQPPVPTPADSGKKEDKPVEEIAVMKTSAGEMKIRFWPDVAPGTVENFKKLARAGFYDGTAFHRIVAGFMIQGGDPLSKDLTKEDVWGTGDPGYKIKAEFNDRKHVEGVLSMARSQHPDSAGSQFFVCLAPAAHLDRNYTGFGQVFSGLEVLRKIGQTPVVRARNGERSKPTERIEVVKVTIEPLEKPAETAPQPSTPSK